MKAVFGTARVQTKSRRPSVDLFPPAWPLNTSANNTSANNNNTSANMSSSHNSGVSSKINPCTNDSHVSTSSGSPLMTGPSPMSSDYEEAVDFEQYEYARLQKVSHARFLFFRTLSVLQEIGDLDQELARYHEEYKLEKETKALEATQAVVRGKWVSESSSALPLHSSNYSGAGCSYRAVNRDLLLSLP